MIHSDTPSNPGRAQGFVCGWSPTLGRTRVVFANSWRRRVAGGAALARSRRSFARCCRHRTAHRRRRRIAGGRRAGVDRGRTGELDQHCCHRLHLRPRDSRCPISLETTGPHIKAPQRDVRKLGLEIYELELHLRHRRKELRATLEVQLTELELDRRAHPRYASITIDGERVAHAR